MKKLLHISLIVFCLTNCRDKNKGTSTVPYVPVNINININQPDFFDLTVVTGWVYVTGGSRGIVVYRKSENEFIALERHATFEVQNNCAVTVMPDGVILDDPCSDSQWLIMDGTIVNGPANTPLMTYNTSFNNPYLSITN